MENWGKCKICQKMIGRESGIFARPGEEAEYCESCFKEGLSRVEVKALDDVRAGDTVLGGFDVLAFAANHVLVRR